MPAAIEDVKQFIQRNWQNTIRQPEEQGEGEERLPFPFTVPTAGPLFHIFFYWDTYFTCEGLVRDGLQEMAQHNANNMLALIERLGYVPNFTIKAEIFRSQPPVASALARLVYEHSRDKTWLAQAHAALEKEYAFWMSFRRGPHGLAHYGHHGMPKDIDNFYWVIRDRLVHVPQGAVERMQYLAHALAEAESGWDFTPRFQRRCADHYAVDLNSLLYLHETNAAWFCEELGISGADIWHARAEKRRQLVDNLCWDAERGFYFDYDYVQAAHSPVPTAAAYFALWCGLASPQQAQRMAANLPLLEANYGLLTCPPGFTPADQPYQWDFPNAWPPMQFAAIAGLLRYGYLHDAKRLAQKYVDVVCRSFSATGNLWEKYNAVEGNVAVTDEYPMPAMLGWTAGTFLYACEVLETQAGIKS